MTASQRRALVFEKILHADKAISASSLAADFSVSRQVIVGDIALLRASGKEILATPHGYIYQAKESEQAGLTCQIACRHHSEHMQAELYAIVDQGCTVVDVIVAHPVYGQLTGSLDLASRYDVDTFIEKSRSAQPMSILTDGIHLHTLHAPDEEAIARVRQALAGLGILME